MRTLFLTLVLLVSASTELASAKVKAQDSRLKKDIQFTDHGVGGKYQVPMEALAVLEDEKTLDDLIGVRKNFSDRIKSSRELK